MSLSFKEKTPQISILMVSILTFQEAVTLFATATQGSVEISTTREAVTNCSKTSSTVIISKISTLVAVVGKMEKRLRKVS